MPEKVIAPTDGSSPEETVTPTAETPVVDQPETLESLTPEPKQEMVPLKKYMEAKSDKKELESTVATLQNELSQLRQASMTGDMSVAATNDAVKDLAAKYPDVNPDFLAEIISSAGKVTAKQIRDEIDKEYVPKLAAMDAERKSEQSEKRFNELFSKTIKDMPEYKGIVNKDVIKSLAFNPASGKKTMGQIIEEAYGNAIQGKKTIEAGHAGREPEPANINNPTPEDWDKINSDPKSKEAWSKQAQDQLSRYL